MDSNFRFLVARPSNRHGRSDYFLETWSGSVGESGESDANLSFLRLTERPQSHRERSSLTGDRADAEAQA